MPEPILMLMNFWAYILGFFGIVYLTIFGMYFESGILTTLGAVTLPFWLILPVKHKESK